MSNVARSTGVPLTKTSIGRFRWMVITLVVVVYAVAAADRANIGIALPYIKHDFGLTNTEAGSLASLFFFAYAFGQIPSAFIVKRFGVRTVLPIALLMTSVFTAMHGLVFSVTALKLARVGLGLSEAPLAISCITTINNWFPYRERGTAAGLFLSSNKIGPVLVPPIAALIITVWTWHHIFTAFALPGLVLPFVWLLTVSNNPRESRFVGPGERNLIESSDSPSETATQQRESKGHFTRLDRLIRARSVERVTTTRRLLTNWNIIGVSLGYFLLAGIINFILTWLPTYLKNVQGLTIVDVGMMSAAPFIGAVLGNLAGGIISDRMLGGRRKPLMVVSCVATIITMYALKSAPHQQQMLAALLFATGALLSLGYSSFCIYPSGLTDRRLFPLATALVNTLGQLGGACTPIITGVLLDHYSWSAVFTTMSIAAAIGFVLLLTIIEPVTTKVD
ncbi:MFS transporter [Caballeronia mineralivorans]|jgi:ACS family glucarate transporter-like MFS transporter|uniref:MFS transporter n=1 Tax=Caballeronia mineralivorans TaxID=2010198 RepID=UPI0023F3BE6D|nr:MFS transporter [Caballeronia mineralivorans]MDB5784946.1 transporter [Caballeronia mineralivorans]MEA3104931.1 hypothetical protein [Caballeronia mineralivorans]